MRCAACGTDIDHGERVGRRDTCSRCGADLHACRQCRFHAPGLANECREPQAERVVDKGRSNFCDYFAPAAPSAAGGAGRSGRDPRGELERLFRKS